MSPLAASVAAHELLELVLNALWQGTVLAVLVAAFLPLIPRSNAATRHVVWWVCLLAVVIGPPMAAGLGAAAGEPIAGAAGGGASLPWLRLPGGGWAAAALGAWAVVSAALLARIPLGFAAMQRLKGSCRPLPRPQGRVAETALLRGQPGRSVRFGCSARVSSPITAGLARPMIIVPTPLLERLTPTELEQILLHELMHIRRRDDWTTLAQRILEAIFFFHPAVILIGRRIDLEREISCDDWVVARTGERKSYARCLTALAESHLLPTPLLASGALLARRQLVRRVTLLLDSARPVHERVSRRPAAAALAGLAAAVVALGQVGPVVGFAPLPAPGAGELPSGPGAAGPAAQEPVPGAGIASDAGMASGAGAAQAGDAAEVALAASTATPAGDHGGSRRAVTAEGSSTSPEASPMARLPAGSSGAGEGAGGARARASGPGASHIPGIAAPSYPDAQGRGLDRLVDWSRVASERAGGGPGAGADEDARAGRPAAGSGAGGGGRGAGGGPLPYGVAASASPPTREGAEGAGTQTERRLPMDSPDPGGDGAPALGDGSSKPPAGEQPAGDSPTPASPRPAGPPASPRPTDPPASPEPGDPPAERGEPSDSLPPPPAQEGPAKDRGPRLVEP